MNLLCFTQFHCRMSEMKYRQVSLYAISLLTPHENLYHSSNLRDNFRFNAIWYRRSMAAHLFCSRLAQSDITVMPVVTRMVWIHFWYNHTAHLVSSSTTLDNLTNMNEKCKYVTWCKPSKKTMKYNQYWIEISCNKPTWIRWTNCWHT
jgi:hypothetical protein